MGRCDAVVHCAEMDLVVFMREAVEFNYWARDRQLGACAGLSEEQFLRKVGGSFPSLRDTLTHLLAVEWLWLQRWRGESPKTLIQGVEFPGLAALTNRWAEVESALRAHLATLDEDALLRSGSYVSTRGEPWTYPLWRMMMHLFNHQSFHRGQVTTQLRLLGVEPPRIDYLVALDSGLLAAGEPPVRPSASEPRQEPTSRR